MVQPAAAGGLEPGRDLAGDPTHLLGGQSPGTDGLRERGRPVDVLLGDVGERLVGADVEDAHQLGGLDAGCSPGRVERDRGGVGVRGHDQEGHGALEGGVARCPALATGDRLDPRGERVATELGPGLHPVHSVPLVGVVSAAPS